MVVGVGGGSGESPCGFMAGGGPPFDSVGSGGGEGGGCIVGNGSIIL